MTEREMTAAAALAMGLRVKWEDVHGCFWIVTELGMPVRPWEPQDSNSECFDIAAALRISVVHNDPGDNRPFVYAECCSRVGRVQRFMEDVPDEYQRADRMRLSILRCAAGQAAAKESA
ncbi:hypothetical protein N5D66_14730 [Delftia tsuruhatensis]|uniref:hypothetical protein n=1 Tax=Delftia TaxID=80865 RepID=UPI000F820FB3|nr:MULTISPECIES: hypothetical protein [Delftia]MDH0849192.1 hypothetical protein [Delftia tsuruhatensis]